MFSSISIDNIFSIAPCIANDPDVYVITQNCELQSNLETTASITINSGVTVFVTHNAGKAWRIHSHTIVISAGAKIDGKGTPFNAFFFYPRAQLLLCSLLLRNISFA